MSNGQPTSSHLEKVIAGIPLLADLHRGDVVIYVPEGNGLVRVLAHAQPHSMPSVYANGMEKATFGINEVPAVALVQKGQFAALSPRVSAGHRAHIVQHAFAITDSHQQQVGVLAIEKSLVEDERHRIRRRPFRRALHDLRDRVLRGETDGLEHLPPFRESDGILVINSEMIITYVSGVGSYLYRRIGYSAELAGVPVAQQTPTDATLAERAFQELKCFVDERYEGERIWIRTVLPLMGPRWRLSDQLLERTGLRGVHAVGPMDRQTVMIIIHDDTSTRRKAQEQMVRTAMVQEIHHRVKNNLQTVASLLRLQARRAPNDDTKTALTEAMNRILSIAVVHEFLSQADKSINLREVAQRIVQQVQDGILNPSQDIRLSVDGDPLFLHAQQTTFLALILNELILNAVEHAFTGQERGEVHIHFEDLGDQCVLEVRDTGVGLPDGFTLDNATNLGLRIIQTIVQDLRGTLTFSHNGEHGTTARIVFPKGVPESFG
jgi:two-component sensor histidine kinase